MRHKPFKVKACISEEDYTYVQNLADTGKSGLFDKSTYHLISGTSLISLAEGLGEALTPGNLSKERESWKSKI